MELKKIFYCFLLLFQTLIIAQETSVNNTDKQFFVQVKVEIKKTKTPIKNADVSVNGKSFYFSEIDGFYKVEARVGDQLVVSHPDFDDVYYTITSNEEIKVVIEGFNPQNLSLYKRKDSFVSYLDSAKFYKTKDIDKSLSFIEKAIKTSKTRDRNAKTYGTLASVYLHWKQYDLAVNNYKLSLQIKENTTAKIGLAKALFNLKEYDKAITAYKKIEQTALSKFEQIVVLEGLADTYFAIKKYTLAKEQFNKAFNIANKNKVNSKITDISSKIAAVFAAEGNLKEANLNYNKSLKFAAKENVNRVLKEEEKVADFLNENKKYDEEIKLRKKSLVKANQKKIAAPQKEIVADSITSQKINYKIGNAYLLKEDYKEAIPFLEKSRKDAKKNKDIVVEKDATRKISEVFSTIGAYDKALENYQQYVALVDSLYIRKEQEIQQAKRFTKRIAENQNRIASLEKDKDLVALDKELAEEKNKNQKAIINTLITVISLLILLAWFMYRNSKQQKLANNLLALKSMRSQMNPHFIFNALNSVNSFIAVNDERNANRYLSEFSVLMRSVLENSDEDFIPLHKEIELLELYVKLEHNRFKNKFDYQINVDENINLEQFSIPPMLLQPYIENAIWHGLRYKKEKGNLIISIQQKDTETVAISITDDGIGRTQSQAVKTKNQLKQKSKGMSTIKNRIKILNDMYKDRIAVAISDVLENGEGTKVTLLLKKK